MAELLPHPLADLFPMLSDAEIALLADDICTFGQREPIVLLDGKILDGRNRHAACVFGQLEPVFVEYDGDDPLNFVLSKNLHRRHLTESQRAMVAAKIVDCFQGMNRHSTKPENITVDRAAKKLSISERAVIAAKRIRDHGAVELVEAIREGRVSVHAGEALSELEHAEQLEVLRREERDIVARAKDIRAKRQKLRHTVRLAHMGRVAENGRATAPGRLDRAYPVYYADPPWKFGVRSEVTGREKSAENHYPTMTTDEIVALLVDLIGGDHPGVFFCWATNPMLLDALRVLQACGFTYVHHWIWDKEVAGTGYWGRDRHELLLIGRRGDVAAPLPGTQPDTVHREKKGPHSAKPAFYAETIERLFPGVPKLEMFCRTPRPGWDHWGYEANPVAKTSEDNGRTSAATGAPMTGEASRPHGADHAGGTPPPIRRDSRRDGTDSHSPERTYSPVSADTAGGAAASPATYATVTAGELAEYKLLGAVAAGVTVVGPLFEKANDQGLIWAGRELTVGGARRLAELARKVEAASDGDAVKIAPEAVPA